MEAILIAACNMHNYNPSQIVHTLSNHTSNKWNSEGAG